MVGTSKPNKTHPFPNFLHTVLCEALEKRIGLLFALGRGIGKPLGEPQRGSFGGHWLCVCERGRERAMQLGQKQSIDRGEKKNARKVFLKRVSMLTRPVPEASARGQCQSQSSLWWLWWMRHTAIYCGLPGQPWIHTWIACMARTNIACIITTYQQLITSVTCDGHVFLRDSRLQ